MPKSEFMLNTNRWKFPSNEFGSLRELFNISQILKFAAMQKEFKFASLQADGQKCERCWHWETDIGQNAEHPTICGRCVEAVKEFAAK